MPLTEQEVRDALNDIIRSGVAINPTTEELLGVTAPRGWGDVLDAPESNDDDGDDSFDIDFDEEQEEEMQDDPEEVHRPSEETGTRLVFNTDGLRGAFVTVADTDSPGISRPAVEWVTAQAGTTRRNPYKKNVIKEDLKSKITIKGVEYDRSECVMLTDNLTWYLKTDPKLVIDVLSGQYIHRERCYVVIESLEIVNKKPVYGKEVHLSKSSYETCPRICSEIYKFDTHILYIDNIKGWEYSEDPERMMIVDYNPKYMEIKSSRNYDSYKNKSSLIAALKGNDGSSSQTYLITEGMKYTFGVEIEVNRGYLPQWMASRNFNLSCVRDGSINGGEGGPEYVTGVLVGDNGIKHLQKICQALSQRTTADRSCGVHLHLGSINFSKKFIVNSYRLALFLEDEIQSTLPKSRRVNQYCRKLKKFDFNPAIGGSIEANIEIEENYNQLFKWVSYEKVNNPTGDYNKSSNHPMGAKCGYNHDTPRYCWINYVPAMFDTRGNKGYSIEIRNHGATTNFNKIRNWLLFFMGFMSFVEKYPELIKEGITMKDVIDTTLPRKSKSLNNYFNERKQLFVYDKNEDNEYKASSETEETKNIKELIYT